MGACDSSKRPNDKTIKNNQFNSSNIFSNPETPELPKLKRRPRLYSQCVNYPRLNLNINNNENSGNENIDSTLITDKKNTSLAFQRRQSMKYCNEFKQNNQIHNNNRLLIHLANSLNRNIIDNNNFYSNYRPEFVIDWRIVKNENTNLYMWKNFGKIPLTSELINSIKNLSFEEISKCDSLYKKRVYFFNYIKDYIMNENNNIINKNQNPILVINRNNILEESFNQFMTTKDLNLKEPIQIHFIDEIAHDAGGVFREWYSCLYKQIFSEKNKFFIENNNNSYIKGTYLIYPKYNNMNLDYYDFFGKLSAKALIDHVNISQNLNRTVVKYLLGENVNLFDMQFYDLDIYNSLKEINDNDNINDNEILRDIKFVWNIKDENGNLKEIELVENGRNINLNNENKHLFIEKVIYYETLYNYEEQIERIKKGFFSLMGNKICKIFQPEEFAYELSGQIEIDLEDWKNNTIYKGHYNKDNKTIKIFWEILSELSQNELFNFFHFCTSSIHVPIDGFNSLKGVNNKIQKFTIEPKLTLILDESNNSNFKLIEAKTCFNRILLPEYSSKEDMKKAIDIILGNDTSFFGLE